MSLRLYFHPFSSFCQKVLVALYENDTPFEPQIVDLGDARSSEDLKKVWPIGKFPVLRDEAKQAQVLAAYIRATHGLNVGLLQWFQLADAMSPLGDGWGLLRVDYTPKPAFFVMQAGQ